MKLLFVVTEDWYFVSHRLALAAAAQAAGFEVVVATRVGRHGEAIRAAGLRLVPFGLARTYGNPLREILALVRLYRRERPDIVHHVALKPIMYGAVAARLARVPAQVNAVVGLGWLFTSAKGVMRLIRPAARWTLALLLRTRSSLTIVQNPDDRALLIRSHLPESRIRLIRGAGVDTTVFAPAPEPAGPVCVVLAARMLWDKGVGEFVEAARLIRQAGVEARFALVGDPDPDNPASVPEAVLRSWHGQDGIEWWGRRDDMPSVYHAAHIACLPSYYREGLPKVLLEAAACGLPLITTDAPGCREVVRDGDNGILVTPRDAQSLARAIGRLIEDEKLRHTMGKRGREIILKDFSSELVVRETLGIYRELVASVMVS
ncbi:MAG TPA: glycosyltransferase family 4 protein [Nitrospira sp.]